MRLIAEMLGRDESSVRVIAPDLGGGFGPKLVFYSEELVTMLAALLLQRPVKWIEDRREHFISTTQERGQLWRLDIAVEADGRIRGVRGSMIHDHGAYTARGINVAFEAAQTMTMAYEVPACDLNVKLALTNKVPVTPVRGAGQPQGVFVMERLLDRVAREELIVRTYDQGFYNAHHFHHASDRPEIYALAREAEFDNEVAIVIDARSGDVIDVVVLPH